MSILDWIDVGKVSAERDDNLFRYFFDNGILARVIGSPSSFLVLGRKGAGKTAVFKYLTESPSQFINKEDVLVALSLEDYNWRIHGLLESQETAASLAFKQSWRFVFLVETVRAFAEKLTTEGKDVPKSLKACVTLLERLFEHPLPSVAHIIGKKLLALSKFALPKGVLDLDSGGLDSIEISGGEVEFTEVEKDVSLKAALSNNIERIIEFLEDGIQKMLPVGGRVFICFDRVDEAWDPVSVDLSKRVIAGLVGAGDAITHRFDGFIRPVIFLREDIFSVLPLNDSNKLREDCGSLLKWDKTSLEKLLLERINFFAKAKGIPAISDIETLFDKKEMRQRLSPFSYILKRSMMRPRDLISFFKRIIDTMQENEIAPFGESKPVGDCLEANAIYEAEPGYSEWLREELIDEWAVQYPLIRDLLNAIQNIGSTNIETEVFKNYLAAQGVKDGDFIEAMRFLFENSVIGFKSGSSTIWKYRAFYPSQGFIETSEYKVHDGLVRFLNLKEPRTSGNDVPD
jgi:hypothetical protein